ncbi:hypothetical protein RY27_27915, partial [Litorilinea aerophila]
AQDSPTLNVTKSGPQVVDSGDTFTYTVTVAGDNQENLSGPIFVTDVVPGELILNSVLTTSGSVTQSGDTVYWTLTPAGTGPYSEQLFLNVTVPDSGVFSCGAGGSVLNTVAASSPTCPECNLSDSDSLLTYVQDPFSPNNTFTKSAAPIELCSPDINQLISVNMSITTGITWTGAIYTDTLGAGTFNAPFYVVPGTTSVLVDGVDRTGDVTITLGPPLVIDFSNIGTFSTSAEIDITYQVTAAAGSIVNDEPSQTAFLFSQFRMDSPLPACNDDYIGYVGTFVTLQRGDLTVSVSPEALNACRENTVTLTVDGGSPDTLTDHVVVTFTASAGDVMTPTNFTLGGAFVGYTPTVTQAGNVVTFTFPPTLDLDGPGTISFPLFRSCGITDPLTADLGYQDRCDIQRDSQDVGGTLLNQSNVTLFATPNRFTVNEREVAWRFYVNNSGNIPATQIVVTNTLPAGHDFVTFTVSSASAPQAVIDSVQYEVGSLPDGRAIITFTIPADPGLPAGTRLQFDVEAAIQTCLLPDVVEIRLSRSCGQVDGACFPNYDTATVELLPPISSLLSSNDQTANLPLCEQGEVELVAKNTSAQATEFNWVITDVITNAIFVTGSAYATVTDESGAVVAGLANVPFTPTVLSNVVGLDTVYTLTWDVATYPTNTEAYQILAERAAGEQVLIRFRVQTDCRGTLVSVRSFGTARDVCDLPLTFSEQSQSLITDAPELVVRKQVRNATENSGFDDTAFAGVGDTLVWEVEVQNVGPQRVLNLFVDDFLPSQFTVTETTPLTSSQDISPTVLHWELQGGDALGAAGTPTDTITFLITGTVAAQACTADNT